MILHFAENVLIKLFMAYHIYVYIFKDDKKGRWWCWLYFLSIFIDIVTSIIYIVDYFKK